jgi:hypothetical protein
VIGKVMKGAKVGGLLRYLFGPGRSNEHTDPHLVAAWDEPASDLNPAHSDGRRDCRPLTRLLEQPLAAATKAPTKPVWHCALRTAPGDRRLSDAEWGDVARDVLHRTGLAPYDDDGACRWAAVRHADDHIHLVVTLVRQDGRRVSTSNDFYRVGEACRETEERFGLTRTAARDRTAAKRPTRAESEKAARTRRTEPPRQQLRREVRAAAAAARDQDDFLARLTGAGLLVRERFSERDPSQITGFAVALPGDRDPAGQPVWFGGGKLAADLSWQKLVRRWDVEPVRRPAPRRLPTDRRPLTGAARTEAWERACRAAAAGAKEIRRLAVTDPGAAADAAHATADALATTAYIAEGRRGGPLTDAATAYDRASRELWGRTPQRSPAGQGLRAAARLLAMTGRVSRDETTQLLLLVANLAALTEAVAALRDGQARVAQARAAREAAEHLRAIAPTGGATGTERRGLLVRRAAASRTHPHVTRPVLTRGQR